MENRLIRYFLAYVIFPKTNNHAQMNTTELYMLKAIVEGKQIDWAFQIRQHIIKSDELEGTKLPYGCHLTNIFRANGIVLDNEWKVKVDAKD